MNKKLLILVSFFIFIVPCLGFAEVPLNATNITNVTNPKVLQQMCNQALPVFGNLVTKVSMGISQSLNGVIAPDGVIFFIAAVVLGIMLAFQRIAIAIIKGLLIINLILFFVFGLLPALTSHLH